MEFMNDQEMNTDSNAVQAVMSTDEAVRAFQAVAVEETQEEKTYVLRELRAKDIFPMTVIIRKIGLKNIGRCFDPEEIKAITSSASGDDKTVDDIAEAVGISVILKIVDVVLENLSEAEQEIFAFMAELSGLTVDNVGNLPMDTFFEMLVDIFKKKEFVGFMKVVSKLLK